MRYLSVCSGIEAASVAWEPLGWEPAGFCEIEPFPSAVLAHRWPKVQNHGDMTQYDKWKHKVGAIDLLVGGTPCQSFSVAGLRKGLHDPRGGLMLTFLEIAQCLKPRWVVWENVPGVLSSHGGRDFGSFLGALGDLGYGWAFRVLDAQWFGLAQRRKRVFVVGCLGDQSLAGAVLFESESVSRNTPPSRKTGQGDPRTPKAGVGGDGQEGGIAESLMATSYKGPGHNRDNNFVVGALTARGPDALGRCQMDAGHLLPVVPYTNSSFGGFEEGVGTLRAHGGDVQGGSETLAVIPIHDQATRHSGKNGDKTCGKGNGLGIGKEGDPAPTLTKGDRHAVLYENRPSDSRVTGPHDVSPSCVARYGTGGGNVPLVREDVVGQVDWRTANSDKGEVSQTLKTDLAHASGPCIAVHENQRAEVRLSDISNAITTPSGKCGQGLPAVVIRESGQGYWMEDKVSGTLRAEGENRPSRPSHVVAYPLDSQNMGENHSSGGKGFGDKDDPSFTITKSHSHAVVFQESDLRHDRDLRVQDVCPTLKANAKAGDTEPKVVAFEPGIAKRDGKANRFVEEKSPTLRNNMGDNQVAVAVDTYNQAIQDKAIPIRSTASDICHTGGVIEPNVRMAVRRLSPRECERLQGFPDDHTLIPWRGKLAEQCPDGPRYKALGNSMAVNCMAWIGKRIDKLHNKS